MAYLSGLTSVSRVSLQRLGCRAVQVRAVSSTTYNNWFSLESVPIGVVERLLINIHDVTGLPWWATIAATTVTLRSLITLPIMIYSMRNNAKLELLQPEISQLAQELNREVAHARVAYKWDKIQTRVHYKVNMKRLVEKLYIRDNCHPLKEFILPWVQIPMWVCMSLSLRSLSGALIVDGASAPVLCSEMATEGVLWFSNLLIPDSTFILPILLCSTNLLLIEMHNLWRQNATLMQKVITNTLRVVTVVMFPIASSVPSSMSLYWTVSSAYGLVQNILLKFPSVRRAVFIPSTPSQSYTPFIDMWTLAKQKLSRTKLS